MLSDKKPANDIQIVSWKSRCQKEPNCYNSSTFNHIIWALYGLMFCYSFHGQSGFFYFAQHIYFILYPLLFDPYRKVSGPFLAKITYIPLFLKENTGQKTYYFHDLHSNYGHFVRIAPTELSIAKKRLEISTSRWPTKSGMSS